MIRYIDAIVAINPDAKVIIKNEDLEQIRWLQGTTPISKENIQTKYNELKTDYDAKAYARKRVAEYPSVVDQLDDLYHNGIDGWKTTIKAVKDKYPKG